jgi:hypothetical protein
VVSFNLVLNVVIGTQQWKYAVMLYQYQQRLLATACF